METSLTQYLEDVRGRHTSPTENAWLLAASLDVQTRVRLVELLRTHETSLVDRATQAFCDTMTDFDAPPGSLRRKKGHQDGRILMRYIGQCVREGSLAPLQDAVLSWLVGHLDEAEVTGRHIECFMHFMLQAIYQELPPWSHRPFQALFEEAIQATRLATYSGVIHRAHRRIAQFVVDRLEVIFADREAIAKAIGSPKCKRDIEMLVKEFAKLLHGPDPDTIVLDTCRWLSERLLSEVEYSADVWYWTLQCFQEGINQCCGTAASFEAGAILEAVSSRVSHLLPATRLLKHAGEVSEAAATALLNEGCELGLFRTDELREQLVKAYRRLTEEVTVLTAAGYLKHRPEWAAGVWMEIVNGGLPTSDMEFQARFLKHLILAGSQTLSDDLQPVFRNSLKPIVDLAKRLDQANRLALSMDGWIESALRRQRLSLLSQPLALVQTVSHLNSLLARVAFAMRCPAEFAQCGSFREWMVTTLFSRPELDLKRFQQQLVQLVRTRSCLDGDLREPVKTWLDEALATTDRALRAQREAATSVAAVRRSVDEAFDSTRNAADSTKARKSGYRDGQILLKRLEDFAVIGGTYGAQRAVDYFQHEIVAQSKLRGEVILSYLQGLERACQNRPLVREQLRALQQALPRLAAAYRLYDQSQELSTQISSRTFAQMPDYAQAVGDEGRAACERDNGIMVRGICRFLLNESLDRNQFQQWWHARIGRFLATFPQHARTAELCASFNLNNAYQVLEEALDSVEFAAVRQLRTDSAPTSDWNFVVEEPQPAAATGSSRGFEALDFAFCEAETAGSSR